MDGVCETHTHHATSSIRREQEEQQESCARRDLVTGGLSDNVLVPPCESLDISWRERRAGLESQAAPRREALAVPVVGNGDGGRRSWEQDGDSAYRTENQQDSELTGTRSAGYTRGSSESNTRTTFSSERPRPMTVARPPTDRDPSATVTMSERGNIGASVPQPHLGTIPPWPPPGGAELTGRVNTVPCLVTGVRSDQWGGDGGQQNNERCLPQLAELADQPVSQVPITPTPYPVKCKVGLFVVTSAKGCCEKHNG